MNEIQFQQSLTTEDLDHDLEFLLILENLLNSAVETVERSVGNLDCFSDNEGSYVLLVLLKLLIHYAEDAVDLSRSERDRLLVLSLSFREKPGYVGHIADDMLELTCQVCFDKYVAGKEDV